MKWKNRAAEIQRLKLKYRGNKYKVPFPDLKFEQNVAPLSNRFTQTMGKKELPPDANKFPVGNSHKQGTVLITPGMIESGQLQYMGGKKT